MEYEWDPRKNESNMAKHRIGFSDAISVFDDPRRLELDTTRPGNGEQRSKVIGRMGPVVIVVIFTMREDRRRIISARRASANERRAYG